MKLSPGTQISHLTLIKRIMDGDSIKWECQCNCENKTIITRGESYLRSQFNHKDRIVSCGCAHPVKVNTGQDANNWNGCGDISGHFFLTMQKNAKVRNIPFNLTIEYIWGLFQEQEGKCALTKLPLILQPYVRGPKIQTASLDRIDPKLPYEEGNVWWVHKDVNLMKNNFDLTYFIQTCKEVTEFNSNPRK